MTALRADDIHRRIDWPAVLVQLGIDPTLLRLKKPGPCPACGGTDRFTFDNRKGRGDFFCRGCGAGSGFDLLMHVHGWAFPDARRHVIEAAGLSSSNVAAAPARRAVAPTLPAAAAASPSRRERSLMASSCGLSDCPDAVAYLMSRGLWPLLEAVGLRGHVGIDYWDEGRKVDKFAAIVAPVADINGELVTAHVTYLQGGQKLQGREPRKLLGKLVGRTGCAVRLMPATDVLGVAEGIETALSAAKRDGIPVWAALNAVLLAKFEPPPQVTTLRIYADRDVAGLTAAGQLMVRLQGRVRFEIHLPAGQHKDFNDELTATRRHGGHHD